MAIIYEEILQRSVQLASGVGGAPLPQVDREITAETIYPHAVRAVYRQQAKTGRHLHNLICEYPIQITNGEGYLPDEVLREYLDRSFLPRVQFGSYVPFEDYQRYRFDSQMSYYATRGAKIVYSGSLPGAISAPSCTATSGSQTITGNASAGQVGDRFALTDLTNGLVVDAFIAAINGTTSFTVQGKTLVGTTAPVVGAISNGQDDIVDDVIGEDRSFTDLVTNIASQTVTSATALFTADDVGKRLQACKTNFITPVVDAIIDSVTNTTTAILRAKPLSTEAACDASILYSPLLLQAVGIPSLPCDLCTGLELAPEIAEDVIVMIAEVLSGRLPMQSLIEVSNHG